MYGLAAIPLTVFTVEPSFIFKVYGAVPVNATLSSALSPTQTEVLPLIDAVGKAPTVTSDEPVPAFLHDASNTVSTV